MDYRGFRCLRGVFDELSRCPPETARNRIRLVRTGAQLVRGSPLATWTTNTSYDSQSGMERLLMWPRQLVVKEIISELRVKVTKIVRQPTGASAGIVETEPCRGPIEVRIVRRALEAFGVLVVCLRPRGLAYSADTDEKG